MKPQKKPTHVEKRKDKKDFVLTKPTMVGFNKVKKG